LQSLVHHLGLALGGRPGQSLARRLWVPVSKDTLLRVVRSHSPGSCAPPHVVGIDDWAWKRGHRYGTIICDLDRHRILDVLPDREAATVEAWLSARPSIRVVSRDRGGGYGQAIARALPKAIQVADRWHLMENASAAFLDAVRKSMPAIRQALGAIRIEPTLLTSAERLQYEGFLRREEIYAAGSRTGGRRSRRLHAAPAVAGRWFAGSCAAKEATCFASASARWRHGSPGWTRSGLPAVAMAPNSGVVSRLPASRAVSAS
jgi:hypothetical protein